MMGLLERSKSFKIGLAVRTQYQCVTGIRTDRQTPQHDKDRAMQSVARVKKMESDQRISIKLSSISLGGEVVSYCICSWRGSGTRQNGNAFSVTRGSNLSRGKYQISRLFFLVNILDFEEHCFN